MTDPPRTQASLGDACNGPIQVDSTLRSILGDESLLQRFCISKHIKERCRVVIHLSPERRVRSHIPTSPRGRGEDALAQRYRKMVSVLRPLPLGTVFRRPTHPTAHPHPGSHPAPHPVPPH